MNIGLLGFGVVGRGVYEITSSRKDMQVTKVLCRKDISLPDAQVVKDFQEILTDDSIDTVVEAIGGVHPAFEFVSAAMKAGKHVVTSNKALMAAYYSELLELMQEHKVMLRCTIIAFCHKIYLEKCFEAMSDAPANHTAGEK